MFDGNHRSRRQVDLSGNRRRKAAGTNRAEAGAGNRSGILEESRRRRELRSKQQEQAKASQTLQRVIRGHHSRMSLVRKIDRLLESSNELGIVARTSCVNLRLAYPPFSQDFRTSVLEKYAGYLRRSTNTPAVASTLAHRIVRVTLGLMALNKIALEAAQTILTHTLLGCSPNFRQVQLGVTGSIALLETLQVLDQSYLALSEELWKVALSVTPASIAGLAALGAAALGCSYLQNLNFTPDELRQWVANMVQVVSPPFSTSFSSDSLASAARRMQDRRSAVILENSMVLYRSHSPAPLIRYLRRLTPALLTMCSFVVRGEKFVWDAADEANSARAPDMDEDDDDDYDSEADMRQRAHASTAADRGKISNTARLTKQDLQTLPKIDRNYHALVTKRRQTVLEQFRTDPNRDAMVKLALQVCVPDQWQQWGKALFSSLDSSEEVLQAQEAYVSVLALLLQSTTGLNARQSVSSHFLTVLALDSQFLERLWRYVLMQSSNSQQPPFLAMSVFCDVFSQRLIAMKDDQFLREYTNAHGPPVISAEHVIIKLRDMLYELYWSKPLRANQVTPVESTFPSDDETEAMRGRLLLTGTKLWHSLYERWCRLVRYAPFCDESTWWFPHMTTLSGDQNVVGMRNHRQETDTEVEMEIDSSDDEADHNDQPMADAETEALAEAFSDPRMARILTCIPQALPFDRRVKMFHSLLVADKLKTQDEASEMRHFMMQMIRGEEGEMSTRARIAIHRDQLYEDSMRQLNPLGPNLKRRVQVSFINQHGQAEAGIDGGGVFKEFIDDLIKEAFSAQRSTSVQLFSVTPLQTLTINTKIPPDESILTQFEFLGRVLGKAVYESILVEPQFCLPFLNQLLGKANSLEDLKNFDAEFYQNLTKLLSMSADEIACLGLTFEVDHGHTSQPVELIHGGRNIHVTKTNVIQYVHLVAHHRLNAESAIQTKAFLHGFRDLIPASWVRLFSAYELQKLISGDDSIRGIDVTSLRGAMQYAAGYHPSQPIMQWFWEVLEELPAEQQRQFLKFMTSCSRQPLLGFASLEPAPCIQQIRLPEPTSNISEDKNAPLPTSSTCMNLLKLPNYRSKEVLKSKLLAAIESGAGFELT